MLRARFLEQGTLADPGGIPDPDFSLPATVHWVRALSILVENENINKSSMAELCMSVQKGNLSDQASNTVFEQLLMSLHHLSSLQAMSGVNKKIDLGRSAIVTWYYGIYHAASAMIAAQDGSFQDNHAETANSWDRQFNGRPYVPKLFSHRVTSLIKKDIASQVDALRNGNNFHIRDCPDNSQQAFGACMSYLKGSADWRREYIEEEVKKRELAKMGLSNFRTAKAIELRDGRLAGKAFGFVHQASRFRGKANYREALFISYGSHVESMLSHFLPDLFKVLEAFLCMAGSFCARRLGKELWNSFNDDLVLNVPLSSTPGQVWLKL